MCECKRCGRVLTSKKSIELGYGRTCYRIHKLNEANKPENTVDLEHELIILKEQINMMGKYIRIQELQNNEVVDSELLNRVRKLELDNNFMKHQLKHKTFVGKSKDSELNWDILKETKEDKEAKNETKSQLTVIIKELKVIFTEDFNYKNILHPVNTIEEIVDPPVLIEIIA